jgi:hypothetical protein
MESLTLERLLADAKKLGSQDDHWSRSYRAFLLFFERLDLITPHDVIIATNFVYGWMPTMLKRVDLSQLEQAADILTSVKQGAILGIDELAVIRSVTNNSIVGTSKLLHFVNPHNFAIWDSRVCRYIYNKDYRVDQSDVYISYLKKCKQLSQLPDFKEFFDIVEAQFPFAISPMRALDVVMFTGDESLSSKNRS